MLINIKSMTMLRTVMVMINMIIMISSWWPEQHCHENNEDSHEYDKCDKYSDYDKYDYNHFLMVA